MLPYYIAITTREEKLQCTPWKQDVINTRAYDNDASVQLLEL